MSGQYPNITSQKAQSDAELLFLQWQQFRQGFYLRSQLGLAFDFFIEVLTSASGFNTIWDSTIAPGNKENTIIESFRSANFSDVDIEGVLGDQALNFFPFSLQKHGIVWAKNSPAQYDTSVCKGLIYRNIDSIYVHAPYVDFKGTNFTNSILKNFYGYQASLSRCSIYDCVFDQAFFNGKDATHSIITWDNLIIKDSSFLSVVFDRILFESHHFSGNNFQGSNFRQYDADVTENFPGTLRNNNFSACHMNFRSENTFVFNNDFTGSIFYPSYNKFSAWIIGNTFFGCTFNDVTFDWYIINNDFRNSNFANAPTFGANADISGSDFTGSNIDTFFPTKADLRAAVNNFNQSTIWVDGTPL